MEPLYSVTIDCLSEEKQIDVYHNDATEFDEPIDILTVSAFYRSYAPTPRTLIRALLDKYSISVEALALQPFMDLRRTNHVWISRELDSSSKTESCLISRIGCVEMTPYSGNSMDEFEKESLILNSFRSYFQMLDLAATAGVKMDTVAIPFLGTGSQKLNQNLIVIPLIRECMECLKRNDAVKRIIFIERSAPKAFLLASTLEKSYAARKETSASYQNKKSSKDPDRKKNAFISYSTKDKNIADTLCQKMEKAGIEVWYAPRDIIKDDYASSIVAAIMDASCFVTMISKNSQESHHVLNEIDIAFNRLREGISLIPLRLDGEQLSPSFQYYLSRFQWMDATDPCLDEKLDEIVQNIIE